MPKATYKVRIPVVNTENYREFIFTNRQQICEFVKISRTTFHAILKNTLKYKHADNMHLKGIIIEKIDNVPVEKPKKEKKDKTNEKIEKMNLIEQKRADFFSSLIQLQDDKQVT